MLYWTRLYPEGYVNPLIVLLHARKTYLTDCYCIVLCIEGVSLFPAVSILWVLSLCVYSVVQTLYILLIYKANHKHLIGYLNHPSDMRNTPAIANKSNPLLIGSVCCLYTQKNDSLWFTTLDVQNLLGCISKNRAMTLGALCFKFLCAVYFIARLVNKPWETANFVSLAVFLSDSVWGCYCLCFFHWQIQWFQKTS